MERRSKGSNFRQGISLTCVLLIAGMGTVALAQEPVAPPAATAQAQPLAPQQLDNLVAPIALYPDPLLGQVLAASTYPVELVEAQQWLQANSGLQGQQLADAAKQQNWDASVQAMVAMPDVLAKLNQDIRWSTDLGNAFLAQPADVMAAVQRMRERAQANGRLQSTPQETVSTQDQNGQQAILIQPADPQVIYVPTYDPAYIWGPPVWGAYPSLYYPAFGFGFYPGCNIGLFFGGWGGWAHGGWGWGPNWFGGGLYVNSAFFNRYGYHYGYGFGRGFGNVAWAHDAAHREGVRYPNAALANRYGAASQASRMNSVRADSYRNFAAGNASRQSFARGAQGGPQVAPRSQNFAAGRQSFQAPAARYSAPAAHYSAPAAHYSAPAAHYSAPAAHYSAPSAPRSFGGGGGGRSYGGGGHAGGGGHGGGRR